MAYGASGAAVVAAAAAIARAIKASGAIVSLSPDDFRKILSRTNKPLVVMARGGVFKPSYQYLTAYKGLFFFARAPEPLVLPGDVELVAADKIWIPG